MTSASASLKIALVLAASTGGIGRHVASLASRYVAAGHQVRIFCPVQTARDQDFATTGAQLLPLSQLGRARTADIVHAHGYRTGALAAASSRLGGPPLVVTWHNAILGSASRPATLAGLGLQRLVAKAADLTLGASSDLVATAERLGAGNARLGPVAAPRLVPSESARGTHDGGSHLVRTALGLREQDVMVLTIGRLAPQKNLDMVLDIAASLRARDDLHFFLVGEGPVRDHLVSRIAAEGSRVSLLGRRDDIAALLSAADMALLTSIWEARALVAQEALTAGLPLVATRVGGIGELVGEAAVLIELDDIGTAAEAITALADQPERRHQLAQAGIQQATSWPDEDQVAENTLAVYRELLHIRSAGHRAADLRTDIG